MDDNLAKAVDLVWSKDVSEQCKGTAQLRKILSIESPPIGDVLLHPGIVARIVEFLKDYEHRQLQFEAAWVLINIASGTSEHTEAVVEGGAVPVLVKLLASPDDGVREQAIWALGNIAGDSAEFRDLVLFQNILPPLLEILNERNLPLNLVKIGTWTLSNLFRRTPPPPVEFVNPALPTLSKLMRHKDGEVLTDCFWGLSYISEGTDDMVENVCSLEIVPRLMELIDNGVWDALNPALRTLENLIQRGPSDWLNSVLKVGLLERLHRLLKQDCRSSTKRHACGVMSVIAARGGVDESQVPAVLSTLTGPTMWPILDASARNSVGKAVGKLLSCGTRAQLEDLLDTVCLECLGSWLVYADNECEHAVLQGWKGLHERGYADLFGKVLEHMSDSYFKVVRMEDMDDEIRRLASSIQGLSLVVDN